MAVNGVCSNPSREFPEDHRCFRPRTCGARLCSRAQPHHVARGTKRRDWYRVRSEWSIAGVAAPGTTVLKARLETAVVKLSAVTVTSQVAGQAAALNQQRAAANVASIIDNELVGRLPDPNLAEALARVPGVAVVRDQRGKGDLSRSAAPMRH